MQREPYQTCRYIAWFAGGNRTSPVVRFYFQRTSIHSLAAQRLAEFSNAFFQNLLHRRSASESADHYISANSGSRKKIDSPRDRPCVDGK